MKKQSGFWFTVACWIVERLLFRGYHLSRNPTKGAERKASLKDRVGMPAEQIGQNCTYPKAEVLENLRRQL